MIIRLEGAEYQLYSAHMILSLRKYVSRVEYKFEVEPPEWDAVFEDRCDGDDEGDGESDDE